MEQWSRCFWWLRIRNQGAGSQGGNLISVSVPVVATSLALVAECQVNTVTEQADPDEPGFWEGMVSKVLWFIRRL